MYIEPIHHHDGIRWISTSSISKDIPPGDLLSWEIPADLNEDQLSQFTFARVLLDGMSVKEACKEYAPNHCAKFALHEKKLEAHRRANRVVGNTLPITTSLPPALIMDMIRVKADLCENVISMVPRKKNYNWLVHLSHILLQISKNQFMFGDDVVNVHHDALGSATGRLRLRPGSFPVSNLKKERRKDLRAISGNLVDIDFNALDIRVFLALSGREQPEGDPHAMHAKLFNVERSEAKRMFFAWLYGSQSPDIMKFASMLEEEYKSKDLLHQYFHDERLINPFDRELHCEERLAMNYLIQSTSADVAFESLINVHRFLRDSPTKIHFLMHDSVILSMPDGAPLDSAAQIGQVWGQTRFGPFPAAVRVGTTWGSMNEI